MCNTFTGLKTGALPHNILQVKHGPKCSRKRTAYSFMSPKDNDQLVWSSCYGELFCGIIMSYDFGKETFLWSFSNVFFVVL